MQLGMTNVLLARTGTANLKEKNEGLSAPLIVVVSCSAVLLVAVMALLFYKFYKRSKVNQGGVEQEQKDQEGLVAGINNDETLDEQQ